MISNAIEDIPKSLPKSKGKHEKTSLIFQFSGTVITTLFMKNATLSQRVNGFRARTPFFHDDLAM